MRIGSSPAYLDASALAKVYFPEPESDELERALLGRRDLIVSDLAVTELTAAIARRVREGIVAAPDGAVVHAELRAHLEEGRYRWEQVTREAHREAERVLMSIGRSVPLRWADALHLGIALRLGAATLVTFDRRMKAAAEAIGTLRVTP